MAERAALQEKMKALPTPEKKDNFHVSADSAMNQNLLSLYEQISKVNGLQMAEDYYYDSTHHSAVLSDARTCVILDFDLCRAENGSLFDYSKYCEMQNAWMMSSQRLFRFYVSEKDIDVSDVSGNGSVRQDCQEGLVQEITQKIRRWMTTDPGNMEVLDKGGSFDKIHIDNTPLEKEFEDLFIDSYGPDALDFLQKEYSISMPGGKNAFVDYVIETADGNFAIEENGVRYHHPQIIRLQAYIHQLEKQNTLSLLGFKTFRFSFENLRFRDQAIDTIRVFLGPKSGFRNARMLKGTRSFALYTHQENFLKEMNQARANGINTSLVVSPTGSGKSQIAIEDIQELQQNGKISRVLVMVPSTRIRGDWENRLRQYRDRLDITIDLYNRSFMRKNNTPPDYYDYLLFDEAQHAQAANCSKTLQYFTPKYLVGLTATPERLDHKKLEDIFGHYQTKMTLKEAIDRDVIANIRCYRLISNIDLSTVRYNGRDYNSADLEKTLIVESRNELIVATLRKYFFPREDFFKQGIIFCVNVNHCRKLEKLMRDAGFSAGAVYGGNPRNDQIFEQYAQKKIQFLISCQLISEGWDSPQTEVVVMARPTLSKVLYTQQIGRGVRKYPGKECLYVIDVVDNYEGKLSPMNFNALFRLPQYSDFMGVKNNNHDYLSILGLSETEIAMQEIDIHTFEEKYQGYLSSEQAARELFIGTATLMNWYRKDNSISSLKLPIGSRMMPYFSPEDIENIRSSKGLGRHDDTTILEDFEAFIDENTLTFSFKLIFMLSMLKLADREGEVSIDELLEEYRAFYLDRIARGLPVDRPNCAYTQEYLNDPVKVKRSILSNPFEKFERKRFVYYSKDLNLLSFHPKLWERLGESKKAEIKEKESTFLEAYYEKLGGL